MKKVLLFSILLLFALPLLLTGESRKVSLPEKKAEKKAETKKGLPPSPASPVKEKKAGEKRSIKAKPLPPKKKTFEESLLGEIPKVSSAIKRSAPLIAGLRKEELQKDPLSFLKRVLETEKSGIRVLPAFSAVKRAPGPPPKHLFYCRECKKKFKSPPFLHAHRIRNDILLIKINKWDRSTYTHVGGFLKKVANGSSLILWDLRDCRGVAPVSVINILSHLRKYKKPSALLVSHRTRGSGELFAKCLEGNDRSLLSAGRKTAGLPFLMTRKNMTLALEQDGRKKKLTVTLLLPQIPRQFSKMDCSPFTPKLVTDLTSYYGQGKDLALHHLCDIFLAENILAKGNRR